MSRAALGGGPTTEPGAHVVPRGGWPRRRQGWLGRGHQGGKLRRLAALTAGAPGTASSTALVPARGSPACGNSAAATPSASVPGPRAAGSGHPRSCQRTSRPPRSIRTCCGHRSTGTAAPHPNLPSQPAGRRLGRVQARGCPAPGGPCSRAPDPICAICADPLEGRRAVSGHRPAPQDPAAVLAARRAACSAVTAASAATRAVSALV